MVRPLLLLAGVVLAVSGALKARSGRRHGLETPKLAIVELLSAVMVAGAATVPSISAVVGFAVVVMAVALMIGSSMHYGLELRVRRRERENSEGARLAAHVKRFSDRREHPK